MSSNLFTATLEGLDCRIVEVETDYRRGNTYISIVGLADKSIQEAKDRIPSAIRNSGAKFIPVRIIMNLAPAELHKSGPSFDLPLAVGYLIASNQIEFNPERKLFLGELALDGRLRPVTGVLPIVDAIKKLGFKEVFLPKDNANEATLIKDIAIYALDNLEQLILHFQGIDTLKPHISNEIQSQNLSEVLLNHDFAQVKGQSHAKRAMEIAAAGGHNILLSGSPGSGKTMISKCLPGILPEMTIEESLEVTRIYSVSGLTSKKDPLVRTRPFRTPHHTSSQVALVGGGTYIKPGEISLAHRGVLFLDEFPEFSSMSLEALRQPLEDKVVTISRASGTLTFPASFILVAAMNPCRCGYLGDESKDCTCSQMEINRYQKKISGPILDRIDLLINVPKVKNKEIFKEKYEETSFEIRKRVQSARQTQMDRFKEDSIFSNSEMSQSHIKKYIKLNSPTKRILQNAMSSMNLTARAYYRLLKVARTIADLESKPEIDEDTVLEALSYRISLS